MHLTHADTPRPAPKRKPSRAAEWPADWWFGRTVRIARRDYMVVGWTGVEDGSKLLFESEDERHCVMPLGEANTRLIRGGIELL